MQISLDETMMKSLVSEALMKALDEEKRNALIQGAIQHLLTPPAASYGGSAKRSPIEDAFRNALEMYANRVAAEMLANDMAGGDKIRSLISDALILITEKNREATVQGIAATIANGLNPRERY